ncbi:hypothetical protein [Nocardia sp. NPDC050717]|uniref:Rv0361 family membrane protein n=1 Tax=Nocardia sp. NPDC050717 TaxID=3157221 RepID=UPI0033D1B108
MAGLSKGLPGGDSGRDNAEDTVRHGGRAARQGDLAGPDAPTTAMRIPGGKSSTPQGGSVDDRTVKVSTAQSKAAQADVPTAGMSEVDRPSPDPKPGAKSAAGAAAAGAAVVGAAAAGADRDDRSDDAAGEPNADAAATSPEATDRAAAEGDRASTRSEGTDATTSVATEDTAGDDAPTVSGSVVGQGTSRSTDVEATHKFQTAAETGGTSQSTKSVDGEAGAADRSGGDSQAPGAAEASEPGGSGRRPGAAAAAAAAAGVGAAAVGAAASDSRGGNSGAGTRGDDAGQAKGSDDAADPQSADARSEARTTERDTAGAADASTAGTTDARTAGAGDAHTAGTGGATTTGTGDAHTAGTGGATTTGTGDARTAGTGGATTTGTGGPGDAGADGAGVAGGAASLKEGEVAGADDQTIAMRVVNPADAPTTAMPIQRVSDRVVPPPGGRAVTPPPNTPRGPAGPRQAGQQHGPHGPGVEETQPSPPRGPSAPNKPASAPSPADIQPTRPAQQLADGNRQGHPQDGPGRPGQQGGPGQAQAGPGKGGQQGGPGPQGQRADLQKGGPRPGGAQQAGLLGADQQGPRGTQQGAPDGQRQVAQPQRIEAPQPADGKAPGRSKKWLLAAAGAAVLVVALIATVVALMSGDNSPEGQVRTAIGTYADALRSGDLDGLRASTCGELHEFYQGITAEQFTGVHQLSTERGSIPVVDSVNAVRITGDTALAEATVYTSADPAKKTARTFDLQLTDGDWKVCDPTATP